MSDTERSAKHLVTIQAEDAGLWFIAQTAAEAYLQQALRVLHAAVEASASPTLLCGVCRQPFRSYLDIFKCGDCEMPCHRDCLRNVHFKEQIAPSERHEFDRLKAEIGAMDATARELLDNARAKVQACDRARTMFHRGHVEMGLNALDAALGSLKSSAVSPREEPKHEWTALDGSLTIRFLQYINAKRAVRWHRNGGIDSWSALEWAGAMAGEAGEACNAAKKLKRIEDEIANINLEDGRSLTDRENASSMIVDEIADTVIYGVLLAERVGLDLEEAIRMKFNRKSEEYGFPERIPPNEKPKASVPLSPEGQEQPSVELTAIRRMCLEAGMTEESTTLMYLQGVFYRLGQELKR